MKKALLMISLSLIPRLLTAQEISLEALAGEDWYGIYFNGQKSGYAESTLRIAEDGSVHVSMDAFFKVSQSGKPQDIRMLDSRVYAPDGQLRSIHAKGLTPTGLAEFEGVVEEGGLRFTTDIGGKKTEEALPKPTETLQDAIRQARLVQGAPNVGDAIEYTRFETMLKQEIKGRSAIESIEERFLDGVAAKVYTVKTEEAFMGMPISSVSHLDSHGRILEDTVANVFKMRLEPKEIAQDVHYSNDVIVSNAVTLAQPISEPRTRPEVRLLLHGPLDVQVLINDERQQFTVTDKGVSFLGKHESLDGLAPVQLPVTEASVQEWLKPSTFIQSGEPRLIEKAKAVLGDETDAYRAAELLCGWVYQNVATSYTASLSNALEVLDTMEGDCTEHSVLFVGLARAVGLPAREVAGLVYTENPKPGLYFHQWAKVWAGRWIDMDPTFNQPIVDATHIKLAEGDLFQQMKLMPLIGQLQAESLEQEGQPNG